MLEPLEAEDGGCGDSSGYNGSRSKLHFGIGSQRIHLGSTDRNVAQWSRGVVADISASTSKFKDQRCLTSKVRKLEL